MSDTAVDEGAIEYKGTDALKNPKYAGKYKGGHADRGDELGAWFRDQVTESTEVTKESEDEDGNVTSTTKTEDVVDYDKVFELMTMNGAKDAFIEKRQEWLDEEKPGAPGRILMDCRNHLKGLARKTERPDQLKGLNGRWSGDAFTLPPKQKAPSRKKKEAETEDA